MYRSISQLKKERAEEANKNKEESKKDLDGNILYCGIVKVYWSEKKNRFVPNKAQI